MMKILVLLFAGVILLILDASVEATFRRHASHGSHLHSWLAKVYQRTLKGIQKHGGHKAAYVLPAYSQGYLQYSVPGAVSYAPDVTNTPAPAYAPLHAPALSYAAPAVISSPAPAANSYAAGPVYVSTPAPVYAPAPVYGSLPYAPPVAAKTKASVYAPAPVYGSASYSAAGVASPAAPVYAPAYSQSAVHAPRPPFAPKGMLVKNAAYPSNVGHSSNPVQGKDAAPQYAPVYAAAGESGSPLAAYALAVAPPLSPSQPTVYPTSTTLIRSPTSAKTLVTAPAFSSVSAHKAQTPAPAALETSPVVVHTTTMIATPSSTSPAPVYSTTTSNPPSTPVPSPVAAPAQPPTLSSHAPAYSTTPVPSTTRRNRTSNTTTAAKKKKSRTTTRVPTPPSTTTPTPAPPSTVASDPSVVYVTSTTIAAAPVASEAPSFAPINAAPTTIAPATLPTAAPSFAPVYTVPTTVAPAALATSAPSSAPVYTVPTTVAPAPLPTAAPSSAPVYTTPTTIAQVPVVSAPPSFALVNTAPTTVAPAPLPTAAPSSAPIYTAPTTIAPAPVTSMAPSSASAYAAPTTIAPGPVASAAPNFAPVNTDPTTVVPAPLPTAAPGSAPVFTSPTTIAPAPATSAAPSSAPVYTVPTTTSAAPLPTAATSSAPLYTIPITTTAAPLPTLAPTAPSSAPVYTDPTTAAPLPTLVTSSAPVYSVPASTTTQSTTATYAPELQPATQYSTDSVTARGNVPVYVLNSFPKAKSISSYKTKNKVITPTPAYNNTLFRWESKAVTINALVADSVSSTTPVTYSEVPDVATSTTSYQSSFGKSGSAVLPIALTSASDDPLPSVAASASENDDNTWPLGDEQLPSFYALVSEKLVASPATLAPSFIPSTVNESYISGAIAALHNYSVANLYPIIAGEYSAIPGKPGIDYPIYSEIPQSDFNCSQQQYPGYFADVSSRCQMFHVCWDNREYNFLCPNGTVFNQQDFVCTWWTEFDCNSAPSLYYLNDNLYRATQPVLGNFDSIPVLYSSDSQDDNQAQNHF